uniref:Uncharacterized protein n=1 Tax=Anguilla anguilla TaxID=7936 RepID=A0A0E9S361_ANGAN
MIYILRCQVSIYLSLVLQL